MSSSINKYNSVTITIIIVIFINILVIVINILVIIIIIVIFISILVIAIVVVVVVTIIVIISSMSRRSKASQNLFILGTKTDTTRRIGFSKPWQLPIRCIWSRVYTPSQSRSCTRCGTGRRPNICTLSMVIAFNMFPPSLRFLSTSYHLQHHHHLHYYHCHHHHHLLHHYHRCQLPRFRHQ